MSELPPSAEEVSLGAAFAANEWHIVAHSNEITEAERTRALGEFTVLCDMVSRVFRPPTEDLAAVQSQKEAHERRARQLVQPISKLVEDARAGTLHSSITVTTTKKIFAKEHFSSLREVLVAGSERICGLEGFGPTCKNLTQRAIKIVDPELAWPEQPDATLAAELYENLKDMPAHILDARIRPLVGVVSLDRALRLSHRALERVIASKRANGEIDWSQWALRGDVTPGAAAANIQTKLKDFAQKYAQAKVLAQRKRLANSDAIRFN